LIRRKGKSKQEKLTQDVAAVNRFGCGCIVFALFGLLAAMIISGYLQLK